CGVCVGGARVGPGGRNNLGWSAGEGCTLPLDPSRPGIGPELVAGADALVPGAAAEWARPFTVGVLLAPPANQARRATPTDKARWSSVDDDQGRAAAGAQLLGFGGSVDAIFGHAAVPSGGMQ